jgi:HAMP domain-containing protein
MAVKKLRGSGVRFTLPYLFRFSGLWLLVTSTAIVLLGVACYAVATGAGDGLDGEARRHLALVLSVQTAALLLAAVALAVFTTHRIAGPFIALKRAIEEVRDGTFHNPLRLRTGDAHLKELEASFNEMADELQTRLGDRPGDSRRPGAVGGGAGGGI